MKVRLPNKIMRNINEDLKNTEIIHNLEFEWGTVIEGKIYDCSFKISVDNDYIPFNIQTEFDKGRVIAILIIKGFVGSVK